MKSSTKPRLSTILLLLTAVGLLFVSPAHAQVYWNKTTGTNDYTNTANWAGGAVPTASQTAAFNTNGDQTVQFNATLGTNPQYLTVGTTGNTLTFNSAGSAQTVVTVGNNMVLGTSSGANVVIQKTGSGNFVFRSASSFQVGGTGGNSNTVTAQGTNVTVGSSSSIVIVGFDNSSGNTLHIKEGAKLVSIGGTIGRANGSTNNTLRLSGTNTTWNVAGTAGANNITIGISAGNDNNSLIVENGAKITSVQPLNAYRGTVHLDNGTIELTNQALTFQAAGRLRGQGSLTASEVKSTASGAIVEVGESGFGVLNATLTGAAGWNNTNIALQLGIGDLTGTPIAGTNYDKLGITGAFTFGGSLTIDLAQVVLPLNYDLALINWTSSAGGTNSMAVSFTNGSALNYEFRTNGLFITAANGYTFTTSSTNAQYWSNTNGWSPVGLPGASDNAMVWGTAGGTTNQTFLTDGNRTVKNLILGGSNATGQLRLRSSDSDTLTVTETLTATNRAVALASTDTNHVLTVNATNLVVDTKNDANILSLGLDDGRVNLSVSGTTTVASGAIHINRGDQSINLGHLSLGDKSLFLSGTNFSIASGTNYSVQVRSLSGSTNSTIQNGFAANTTLEIQGDNTSPATFSGTISNGVGVVALTKQGTGTQVLQGHNTFTGATTVSGGVLELKSTTGPALGATASIFIAGTATLLISESNQINNTNTAITLTGGTIKRASGVSETFGNLTVGPASTLDFGSGTEGALNFGTYAPSALLTVNNFFKDNTLTFKSDLTSLISNNSYFSFSGAFSSGWDVGSETFTITAIPEPSTLVVAAALLGLLLWPVGRQASHKQKNAVILSAAQDKGQQDKPSIFSL